MAPNVCHNYQGRNDQVFMILLFNSMNISLAASPEKKNQVVSDKVTMEARLLNLHSQSTCSENGCPTEYALV
jgi:hypothetical protein